MYIVLYICIYLLIYLVLIILLLEDKLIKNDLISVHNFILFQVTKQFFPMILILTTKYICH